MFMELKEEAHRVELAMKWKQILNLLLGRKSETVKQYSYFFPLKYIIQTTCFFFLK